MASRGLRKVWEKGPRTEVSAVDKNGKSVVRLGKNGGPIVRQDVTLRLIPKGRA